jgi:hypothetical protein
MHDVQGSAVDTGEIQLFSVGIPGLDIPGYARDLSLISAF